MRKSLLYTLFRFGKLPKAMRPVLEQEGIILCDEGLSASVTLRNFRAPGRYSSYKKSLIAGSIVVTGIRFAAFSFSRPLINVPLHDDRLRDLELSMARENVLSVQFDVAAFHEGWSGSFDCRFKTPIAHQIMEKIAAAQGGV